MDKFLKFVIVLALMIYHFDKVYAQNDYDFYIRNSYPKYKDVVNNFFKTYNVRPVDFSSYYKFEKRPDGYYVCSVHFPDTVISNPFWTFKSGYLKLPIKKRKDKRMDVSEFVDRYVRREEFEFDKNLFYGYKNYSKDVINILGNKSSLTDDWLYCLANSYYDFANNLFLKYKDTATYSEVLKISSDTIQLISKHYTSSQDIYLKLYLKSPNYKIGTAPLNKDISSVLFNNSVNSFYNLSILGNDTLGKSLLGLNLSEFEKSQLSKVRNELEQVPPYSIFISNNQKNLFLLLYLQNFTRIRRDVVIVDEDRLEDPLYLVFLNKLIDSPQKINLSINLKTYFDIKNVGIHPIKPFSDTVDFVTVSNFYNKEDIIDKIQIGAFYKRYYDFPFDLISFKVNKTNFKRDSEKIRDSIYIDGSEFNYKGVLPLFDILYSNSDRYICKDKLLHGPIFHFQYCFRPYEDFELFIPFKYREDKIDKQTLIIK